MRWSSLFLFLFSSCFLLAQKPITNEAIWKDREFAEQTVPGFTFQNDGVHYTRMEADKIEQYDLRDGKKTRTLFDAKAIETDAADWEGTFDSYTFSQNEDALLLATQTRSIYRRSKEAQYFVYNMENGQLQRLYVGEKQRHASFSPDGQNVAFVVANDLYYKNLPSGKTTRITTDGRLNYIINGASDWVYEEEFSLVQAFEWSPDGQQIAFLRFDESEVKTFYLEEINQQTYPEFEQFKYPKVGEANARVSAWIFSLKTQEKNQVPVEAEYMPRLQWTPGNTLCLTTMNRHQNQLTLWLTNPKDGKTEKLLEESSPYYLRLTEPYFLKSDGAFIWASEQSGFKHFYLHHIDGSKPKALTKGDFEATELLGVDEENQLLYYQAAAENPMQRELYSVKLNGRGRKKLSAEKGTHKAQFSKTCAYYIDAFSTINTPTVYTVRDRTGKQIRTLEDNAALAQMQQTYGTLPMEFIRIPLENIEAPEGKTWTGELNGWMLRPQGPEYAGKKLPLLMFVYGGPGSQQVTDQWKGDRYWWFQMLAQQGYAVACVDNRGTGARGAFFQKQTYLNLGKYETIDQIAAAKFLGNMDFIDADRIGIFGWSYGGYMSSLCLLKGNDVFRAGIAVAPVTHWKWYDNIYTERYMRTVEENPDGYRESAPLNFVKNLKGEYLLVHGLTDDNVHFQHSAEMANALISANKQFDTMIYPNRNHSISDRAARLHLYILMTNFLNQALAPRTDALPGRLKP
jgi:dipeptidyl-peptidase-4